MKLYFAPGACSLSPHIVLEEAGIAAEIEKVDLRTRKTASGADYTAINPKGYVPALQLDDGSVLTEGPAIIQYLADQKPATGLAPANGTLPRYQLQETLNFLTSEVHKTFGALFNPNLPAETRAATVAQLNRRYDFIEQQLAGKSYLLGEQFTVADAYLFTVTSWGNVLKVDVQSSRPNLKSYMQRVGSRPAVLAALKAEGLLQ